MYVYFHCAFENDFLKFMKLIRLIPQFFTSKMLWGNLDMVTITSNKTTAMEMLTVIFTTT